METDDVGERTAAAAAVERRLKVERECFSSTCKLLSDSSNQDQDQSIHRAEKVCIIPKRPTASNQ